MSWLDANVAYLTLSSMADVDGFAHFIVDSVGEIDRKHARGLIVDLRHNTGGSTDVAELLLERITEKPYRIVAGNTGECPSNTNSKRSIAPTTVRPFPEPRCTSQSQRALRSAFCRATTGRCAS